MIKMFKIIKNLVLQGFTNSEIINILNGKDYRNYYKKNAKFFTKEEIKKAIEIGIDLDILYEQTIDNFDKELVKFAIQKGIDLHYLYKYLPDNLIDDEIIELAIKNKKGVFELYPKIIDKLTPELLDFILSNNIYINDLLKTFKKLNKKLDKNFLEKLINYNVKNLIHLTEYYPELFDRNMMERLIELESGGIYNLIKKVPEKFDKELLLKIINFYDYEDTYQLKSFFEELYKIFAKKEIFDEEIIKAAIKRGIAIYVIYYLIPEKFNKNLIKYAIMNDKVNIGILYKNLAYKFDDELIEFAIKNGAKVEYLYYYLNKQGKKIYEGMV